MILNTVNCTIERRLLVNYRVDPELVASLLPAPFRPQIVNDSAVAGVCFLRLTELRPPGVPRSFGIATENVAHRFAVEWDEDNHVEVGVYVPQRQTNSRISALAGGRIFAGDHQMAHFHVADASGNLQIEVATHDNGMNLYAAASKSKTFDSELFSSVDDAMDFFRLGSLGFSPNPRLGILEGVRLHCQNWVARSVHVSTMQSSVFDDTAVFPAGSCVLDSGLVMRNLPVRWSVETSLPTRQWEMT